MSTPIKIYENWSNGLNIHMGSQQRDRQADTKHKYAQAHITS